VALCWVFVVFCGVLPLHRCTVLLLATNSVSGNVLCLIERDTVDVLLCNFGSFKIG